MGFLSKKPDKSGKMRTLKVRLAASKKRATKSVTKAGKAGKPMSFSEWVEHYAKMSGGNPV